jgi:hypothetical protein
MSIPFEMSGEDGSVKQHTRDEGDSGIIIVHLATIGID